MIIITFVAAAVGCSSSAPDEPTATPPVDLSGEWATASAAAVGLDSAQLATALADASQVPGLRSVLLVRHGRLAAERYIDGNGIDSLYSVRSVTKSVMALLTGLAIANRLIPSTAATIGTYFVPPLPVPSIAAQAIRIQDLLTMSSGFEWNEGADVTEYNDWVTAPDQVAYLFAQPLVAAPGSTFNYNSAAVHLLSVIITVADTEGTAAFADRVLFSPLGVHHREWELDNRGIPNGGAGLYIRPRDMAKIGTLVLQGGLSGTKAVVPKPWIDESTRLQIGTGEQFGALGVLNYGDLWWLGHFRNHDVVFAWGYGGQFIVIIPDFDLVVVTTAAWQGLAGAAPAHERAIMAFITGDLLAALH